MRVLLSILAVAAAINFSPAPHSLADKFLSLAHVKQAPGDEAPVDEEGYSKDWTTEHRNEPYPADSKGKQHHPDFDETVKVQLEHQIRMHSWGFWVACLIVAGIIGGIVYKFRQ